MNNIFTEMIIPQLGDPTFQTEFTDFCNAMKQNIERLISINYAKGEPGNSVYTKNIHTGYSNLGKLNNMSAGILNSIFGNNFDTTMGPSDVNDIIAGVGSNIMVDNDYFTSGGIAPSIMVDGVEYKAIPSFMNSLDGIDVEINIDDVTGVAYLASPYIFIDNRIAGLNRMVRNHANDEDVYKTFHDFSIAVYGKGTCDIINHPEQDPENPATWEWEFESVQMVPKIYFDDTINEFCWNVNGMETGVTAQGIKGDNGISPNMIIAIGTKATAVINIDKIQYIDEENEAQWAESYNEGIWGYYDQSSQFHEIDQPKTNDFVLVFFTDVQGDPQEYETFSNAYIGKIYVDEDGVHTYIGSDGNMRCDIFESIRLHDYWRLMMTINSNTTGAPRGYLLPADPDQSPVNPSTIPSKTHMIYSEKINTDNYGFGKLHSAPVLRDINNPAQDPTRMSQTENPQADHIGDWQIDYNMDIQGNVNIERNIGVQGNSMIQGNSVVQGNSTVQGILNVQGNSVVQGNMTVQGQLTSDSITTSGVQFPVHVKDTRLACMSRFTDILYTLDRDMPDYSQGYYEINSSYGEPYRVIRLAQNNINIGSIKYSLNFQANLEITIGMISAFNSNDTYAPHDAISGYVQGDKWEDSIALTPGVIPQIPYNKYICQNFNNDNLVYGNSGRRSKMYNAVKYTIPIKTSKSIEFFPYGRTYFLDNLDYDKILDIAYMGAQGTSNPVKPRDASGNVSDLRSQHIKIFCNTLRSNIFNTYDDISYRGYVGTIHDDPGVDYTIGKDVRVQGIQGVYEYVNLTNDSDLLVGAIGTVASLMQNDFSQNYLESKYKFHGVLQYKPLNIDIEYYTDIFARIFEYIKLGSNTNDIIRLGVTPVGCLIYRDTNIRYMAPIWNALNTNNYIETQTIKNIYNAAGSIHVSFGDICEPGKQELNPLVSGEFIDSQYDGCAVGTILSGSKNNSQNIVSLFDNPNYDIIKNKNIRTVDCPDISTLGFDITHNIRLVENNVKICANNQNDGSWKLGSNGVYWESTNGVPIVVIPYEGYVDEHKIEQSVQGIYKIGVGNTMYDKVSSVGGMELHGMLIYPYSPALITKDNGNMDTLTDVYEDADVSDGYTQGTVFINGRVVGISDGGVCGIG